MTIIRNVTKNDEPVLTQVNPRGRRSPMANNRGEPKKKNKE